MQLSLTMAMTSGKLVKLGKVGKVSQQAQPNRAPNWTISMAT